MEIKRTVCVIDDDEFVRMTMCAALDDAGFITVQAKDGAAGLREIERSGALIAIIDMIMPGEDGVETITNAKRRFPNLKILAISGGWSSVTPSVLLDMAQNLGADDVLAKPFRNAELVAKITSLAG